MGEEETNGYFLDWLIEPIADMLESFIGWEHEKAVSTIKAIVYLVLIAVVVVTVLKIYWWFK